MASVKCFTFNPFQVNTYVVYDETLACVIIDAACMSVDEQDELLMFIKKNNLKPQKLINTHGHVDHLLGNHFIFEQFGLSPILQYNDTFLLDTAESHAAAYGLIYKTSPKPENSINDGDVITFGTTELHTVAVPGHSPGCIALVDKKDNFVITGDILFNGSIGRTDLPGGNYGMLIKGIKEKLLTLDESFMVYPGHGSTTTIYKEKKSNPFLT